MSNDIRSRIMQFSCQPVPHETKELGTVYIRRLTLGEMRRMQEESKDPAIKEMPLSVRLLSYFIGDDKGQPVFSVHKADDVAVLQTLPVSAASDLLRAGNSVNNMNEEVAAKND